MKGYAQEHLEAVAERNRLLFQCDPQKFRNYMSMHFWSPNEIEQMIVYLNRKRGQ